MGATSSAAVTLVGIFLRRLLLPIVLVLSAVFRYNVVSLVNILLFFVSVLIPGPNLKSQKGSFLIYLSVVTVWSLVALLGQVFFQIVLATDYSDQLQPCSSKEYNWRQFGFILFHGENVRGVDVVRHLVPDIMVFSTALITFIMNCFILFGWRMPKCAKKNVRETALSEEPVDDQEVTSEEAGQNVSYDYPSHIQCYWQLPHCIKPIFEMGIFVTLGLSGVAVPSLTSFIYYAVFMIMLALWSCHRCLKWRGVTRVLRCGLSFYTMLHLVALYLYQFQAAQQNIPLNPVNTTKSLIARLFGLTAVIFTDCEYPNQLLLHSGVEYPYYVNPFLLLLLYLLLATDMRFWINTPEILWQKDETYYLPVKDSPPSSAIFFITSGQSSPIQWTSYGTYAMRGTSVKGIAGDTQSKHVQSYREYQEETGDVDEGRSNVEAKNKRILWKYLKMRIKNLIMNIWRTLLQVSYIPAIFCMMLWSVLYPSWPALVLLLWACVIWLIPRFTPKDSLFYTSPALAVYAVCLLILQYLFSLNLTSEELSPVDGVGEECYNSDTPGCKSLVPLIKTCFAIVFFCALHEFVRMRRSQHQSDEATDGEMRLIALHEQERDKGTPVTHIQEVCAELMRNMLNLLSAYWTLVVVAAFLLVFLSGEPNLFNTIYLVFFFLFLVIFQVFKQYWYYACIPMWWGLVLYAALELILIYTYQFDVVSDAWERAYNKTPAISVDSDDLFRSIGLRKYGINSLRSLCVSLLPPAVFIAVMAMQLRYFNPISTSSTSQISSMQPSSISSNKSESTDVKVEEDTAVSAQQPSGMKASPVTPMPETSLSFIRKLSSFLLRKTKQFTYQTVETFWRFLELHLHRISMLLLFVVALSEISAGYWVLLIFALVTLPLPLFNIFLYPLMTVYIGILLVLKTIYQFPIVDPDKFNLSIYNETESNQECSEILNITSYLGNYSGSVFNYQYSSRVNDGGWFGLHKVSNYAQYIGGPLCLALLLSLHFSTKRRQANHFHSKIVISSWEKKSLFLNVSKQKAEMSAIAAWKYFINHVFEMYGVEITFILISIAVAVRIDVYGVFYCLVLGVLLLAPRRFMAPLWLLYTVIHGLLLILQYSMLLGVPHGACFYPGGDRGYPWDTMADQDITNFGLKKWLFLSDYPQMLDKNILYVDFVVYVLLSSQIYNFRNIKEFQDPLSDYLQVDNLMNYIKVFVTKYYFWISLFLVFFTAITRVSFFGFLYLLLCFILLYRGQNMLMDSKSRRIKSWAGLRFLSWTILLIRVCVQIIGCVFYKDVKQSTQCKLILALNGGCNREAFYGSPTQDCPAYPNNVGIWVDVLSFAVVTIQIIVFDTQYSEMMREYLVERSNTAGYFSDVLEKKMNERVEKALLEKDQEFEQLNKRVEELSFSEKTVDHMLHAGTIIPSNVIVRSEKVQGVVDISTSRVSWTSDEEGLDQPRSKTSVKETSVHSEAEASKLSWIRKFVYKSIIELIDRMIDWLERSSSLYKEVVDELKSTEESVEGGLMEFADNSSPYSGESVEVTVEQKSGSDEREASSQLKSAQLHQPAETKPEDIEIQPLPAKDEEQFAADLEANFHKAATNYSQRPVRLIRALQYALLAHTEYVIYFLVILNVIINGSVLSLGYVCLLFAWGLLCVPWPSKTFWLSMIFYSMLVLTVKYVFQFYNINYDDENLQSETGFSTSSILGIVYYHNSVDFFKNATWDMLLLISLLINRGLLKQNGLWKDYSKEQLSVVNRLKRDTKLFFSRLLNPDISHGAADYYVIMLFFDVLCFITIIFGISSFGVGIGGGGLGQAATYIQNNYVPVPFVVMLLLQFLSMLVDRAIYLRHALKAKFVFQIILLTVWHIWLLFILPSESVTRIPFTQNTAAQCLYFFKSLYFIVSAMQIVAGYPTRILGYFLGRHYTTVSGIIFSGYRAIPLLPELREVMDWVFTDTALPLFHWLRVQEIYAKLYLVKVRRHREKDSPRSLGEKQSLLIKIFLGGVMLIFLVMLLWGPLLVISFINTTSVSNPPVAATISMSFDAYEPLVQISIQHESIASLTNSEYQVLKNSLNSEVQPQFQSEVLRTDFTKAIFPNESTSLWTISPPAKSLLLKNLLSVKEGNASIFMQFSWQIQREPRISSATEVVSGLNSRRITYQQEPSTVDDLISTLSGNATEVSLFSLYPRVVYAPDAGPSRNYTELSRFFSYSDIMCSTSLLRNMSNQEWWTLYNCTNPINKTTGPPVLLIYSERIAPEIFGIIAGFGIIGLYVSVVLVIGRLIRSSVSSLPADLLLDEIVNPEKLLKLCNDIFVVRESRNFELEEILVGKLFAIFRSPDKLIEVTENVKPKED